MMDKKVKKLVLSALFVALTYVATIIIRIPAPPKGYINLGDCIVLLSGYLLGPVYGGIAAGFGSALADLHAGYAIYAPATFVIKGLAALLAAVCYRAIGRNMKGAIFGAICGEVVVVLGYFVFEWFMMLSEGSFKAAFSAAAMGIPMSFIQGIVGGVLAVIMYRVLRRKGLI